MRGKVTFFWLHKIYGKVLRWLEMAAFLFNAGMLGAQNNDSHLKKWGIVKFYIVEYRKCGNSE